MRVMRCAVIDMKLTINDFIQREYGDGSRPTSKTILNRLKRGDIPYHWRKEGGIVYIDLSRPKSKNPLVEKVLCKEGA